jgi:hypothetical protein
MRTPNRTHDRTSFFKYMSAEVAHLVLTNATLRWSSPTLFNDPFDVPRELSFGITADALGLALGAKMAQLIEDPPDETTQLVPELRLIVEMVKKGIPAQLKAEMLAGLRDSDCCQPQKGDSLEEMRRMWRRLIPDYRILCLTESATHTAMWYHYADKYRGVVLEFLCSDELDSAWLAAQPVAYPDPKPQIYSADGWAEIMCQRQDLAVKTILNLATYTKSPDWRYESEWRIASHKRPSDTGDFTDYKFDRRELGGVYFGPMSPLEVRSSLAELAEAYPSARLWDVSIGMSREFVFKAHAQD